MALCLSDSPKLAASESLSPRRARPAQIPFATSLPSEQSVSLPIRGTKKTAEPTLNGQENKNPQKRHQKQTSTGSRPPFGIQSDKRQDTTVGIKTNYDRGYESENILQHHGSYPKTQMRELTNKITDSPPPVGQAHPEPHFLSPTSSQSPPERKVGMFALANTRRKPLPPMDLLKDQGTLTPKISSSPPPSPSVLIATEGQASAGGRHGASGGESFEKPRAVLLENKEKNFSPLSISPPGGGKGHLANSKIEENRLKGLQFEHRTKYSVGRRNEMEMSVFESPRWVTRRKPFVLTPENQKFLKYFLDPERIQQGREPSNITFSFVRGGVGPVYERKDDQLEIKGEGGEDPLEGSSPQVVGETPTSDLLKFLGASAKMNVGLKVTSSLQRRQEAFTESRRKGEEANFGSKKRKDIADLLLDGLAEEAVPRESQSSPSCWIPPTSCSRSAWHPIQKETSRVTVLERAYPAPSAKEKARLRNDAEMREEGTLPTVEELEKNYIVRKYAGLKQEKSPGKKRFSVSNVSLLKRTRRKLDEMLRDKEKGRSYKKQIELI